jgi:hypothetical protein
VVHVTRHPLRRSGLIGFKERDLVPTALEPGLDSLCRLRDECPFTSRLSSVGTSVVARAHRWSGAGKHQGRESTEAVQDLYEDDESVGSFPCFESHEGRPRPE